MSSVTPTPLTPASIQQLRDLRRTNIVLYAALVRGMGINFQNNTTACSISAQGQLVPADASAQIVVTCVSPHRWLLGVTYWPQEWTASYDAKAGTLHLAPLSRRVITVSTTSGSQPRRFTAASGITVNLSVLSKAQRIVRGKTTGLLDASVSPSPARTAYNRKWQVLDMGAALSEQPSSPPRAGMDIAFETPLSIPSRSRSARGLTRLDFGGVTAQPGPFVESLGDKVRVALPTDGEAFDTPIPGPPNRFGTVDIPRSPSGFSPYISLPITTGDFEIESTENKTVGVEVWYGSDRADKAGKPDIKGSNHGPLHFGRVEVKLDRDMPVGGYAPSFFRWVTRKGDGFEVGAPQGMPEAEFWPAIARAFHDRKRPSRSALVFVHGYCNTFASAAKTAAMLARNAAHGFSEVAMFSWPSRGAVGGYVADLAECDLSAPVFADFLRRFARRSSAERVHVVAHSMGAKLVLQALLAAPMPEKLDNIILAAPDVDRRLFAQQYAKLREQTARLTLYASKSDYALKLSKYVSDTERVGISPPLTTAAGLDSIDVTNVDLSRNGHRALRESGEVLRDVFLLTSHGLDPLARGLESGPVTDSFPTWWIREFRRG